MLKPTTPPLLLPPCIRLQEPRFVVVAHEACQGQVLQMLQPKSPLVYTSCANKELLLAEPLLFRRSKRNTKAHGPG